MAELTATTAKGHGPRRPFSPQAAAALDRHLRAWRSHKLASTPSVWLGSHGKSFAYIGLNDTLRDRARTAGHPRLSLHSASARGRRRGLSLTFRLRGQPRPS